MKQFFKFMFASMVGSILAGILLFFIFIGIIAAMISGLKRDEYLIPKNSILHLTFANEIWDRSTNDPLQTFDFSTFKSKTPNGLNDILSCISKAKKDPNIKGVLLELNEIKAGFATIEEIRNGLLDFKKSGKFVISYSEAYSQKAYYLSSVSDKIYLNPEGIIEFKGLAAQILFYKGLLQKAEVDAQIIRHGKYKSAIEPFILDKMSDANKEQTLSYINSIWGEVLKNISVSRKISEEKLAEIANTLSLQTAMDAVNLKIADSAIYKDELLSILKKKTGETANNSDVSLISIEDYRVSPPVEKLKIEKNKIAVIYAIGQIESGLGNSKSIGSETLSKTIRNARIDDKIKAIVIRVNSPGGSALASEIIWREVLLAKNVKPVVVSMGDVAASGGYYIACAANKIVADPKTITGSIGVFGMVPNFKKLLNNKLGITVDGVKTNAYADFMSTLKPMDAFEYKVIQKSIESIYATFTKHVAEGRGLSLEVVDSIAQGRVWSGVEAKNIGLIDEFGGLEKAIEIAAKLAKLDSYKIIELPKQKDALTQLIEDLSGKSSTIQTLERELGTDFTYFQYLQSINKMKGIQALLPYVIEIQ